MIKVNLLKGEGTQTGQSTAAGTSLSSMTFTDMINRFRGGGGSSGISSSSEVNGGLLLVNLVLLLFFPGLLYFYEIQNLDQLKLKSAQAQAQVSEAQGKLSQVQSEVAQSATLQAKARELSAKIDIVTQLSRLRLREVKTLDFIQSVIPERVWLSDVEFDAGKFKLKGAALTDDDLTNFVRSLENNANFSNVLLLQAKEEVRKDSSVKTFEVSALVEAVQ